jgi:protein-S-isoprenylcysteine O-methyltransferase Ste14
LAVTEEAEMRLQFGEMYERYAQQMPRFFPHINHSSSVTGT